MGANRMLNQFALFVPPADQAEHAEITFGGHNAARLNSPLAWVPVEKPELGYWQVRITSVSIGDREFEICGSSGCRGIIDSSSSRIGVPTESFEKLKKGLTVSTPRESFLSGGRCDMAEGPPLRLTLNGRITLTLNSKDYAGREGGACVPLLHPWTLSEQRDLGRRVETGELVRPGGLGVDTLILGEPVLRRYYTVFDWGAKRVGFGLASGQPSRQQEFILMQTQTKWGKVEL